MMKTLFLSALAVFTLYAVAPAMAAPELGKPAPDFTATDTNGKEHKLGDYKGKIVVMEWTNPGCPFVKKHYVSKNMQGLQAKYTAQDVVWLSVNSSAAGKEGNQTNDEANAYMKEVGAASTARLVDAQGSLGQLYGAKTTPHMFVINKEGVLAYEGAIDDNDSANVGDALTAKNYVAAALDSLIAGKPVETAKTQSYGCSVKY